MSGAAAGVVRIGARRSPLAVAQAEWVGERLRALGTEVELIGIDTRGDVDRRHLTEIGGTGVFAVAVRDAVRSGAVDVAVHSMKDLPTAPAPGLVIAAVPPREDPRDVLVGHRLAELADGMVIGTGSPRRQAQLQAYAGARGLQLEFRPIRGNVGTRLELVSSGTVDATVLAAAGLRRLGLVDSLPTHEFLELDVLAPAAAQGALAVEIAAAARPGVPELIARLDDAETRLAVDVERAFLRELEAGCLAPVGVLVRRTPSADGSADLTFSAVIGRTLVSTSAGPTSDDVVRLERTLGGGPFSGEQGVEFGRELAKAALARLT
ncbi:hydroxymethylbilane synthase [Enemella dayhoffiae]|uniref:Hydroxymethylbilane synthase n=1 Tax=Enemella dayhoffiae TaxID=2016507 RepID=A0A255H563_9ACTN|nr:hydroxymethylbilane synthase [Enemella dayhoffiae]OYO22795.1 hydroxymethylbilane synthase [Enemella dayhoffiae]